MKVVVVGAGVIGMCTAWYLVQDGHEVVVVDRAAGPGLETSYANAGEIAPSYCAPLAAPGLVRRALAAMLSPHGALRFRPRLDRAQWRWLWKLLGNANIMAYERNLMRMQRLAVYSLDRFIELRERTGWRYDDRQRGTLLLYRDGRRLEAVESDLEVLRSFGVQVDVLEPEQCLRVEPGLGRVARRIAGALHMPDDETGDCLMFCNLLYERLHGQGAEFHFGAAVDAVWTVGDKVSAVRSGDRTFHGDAYVLAAGSASPLLARPLGLDLPIYPLKGYSLTLPIRDERRAPRSAVHDEEHQVSITRLGDRIRVAGTAELGGWDRAVRRQRLETLRHVLRDAFRGAYERQGLTTWAGLRPATPDGTPIVGRSPYRNLFLNTGHGSFGWTMSLGSGRVVADLIHGRQPDIDITGLELSRYAAE